MKPLWSLFYPEWIEIRDGRATVLKGNLPGVTMRDLSSVFEHDPGLVGHIRSSGNRRYRFSRSIPEPLRQRARNVLASR